MDTEVRNRKNKKSPSKKEKTKPINDKTTKDEIEERRFSGDGDSDAHTITLEHKKNSAVTNGSAHKVDTKKNVKGIKSPELALTLKFDLVSFIMFAVCFASRIWKIKSPNSIVFDELHYGKYAGLYVQKTFFFDSQPPLGKQILALTGYLFGLTGEYKFDRIGADYDPTVPIIALRTVPAFFGSLLMPVIYSLLTELGISNSAGALAVFLLIFDNAILIQSRYVLMESFLLFFGFFGLLCVLRFRRFYSRPFSFPWFLYLSLAASSLSAAFCVRYFGGFTLLLGVAILVKDFWKMVGDRLVSDFQLFFHFLMRAIILVTIPVGIYIAVFYVHLNILTKAGPNDNIMTSAFQATLEGGLSSIVANQPLKVVHGSQITLRHTHGKTCWLHSHDAVYPVKYADDRGSSHQQQVTCYSYKDVNNWWIVKKPEIEELVVTEPQEPIKDGDIIQIVHGLTSRALNTHDVASALSPHAQEVSCYIDYNISMPAQTLWKVHLLNKDSTEGFWHALDSQIRLVHINTTAGLKFGGRQLPEWGFRQHEVVADRTLDQEDSIWNVEEHRYSRTEDKEEREKELIRQEMIPTERRNMSFWEKLFELQYKMIYNNQENVAGHMYASDPIDWPILKRGVAYWISPNSNAQIHFLGNVVTWLSGTCSILLYMVLFVIYLLRRQRAFFDIPDDAWNKFVNVGEVLVVGYFVHYFPYFLVDRTLFLHHYIPAYIFKICVLAAVIDHLHYVCSKVINSKILSWLYILIIGIWMAAILFVFYTFSSVTYGDVDLTSDQVTKLSWFETWDLIVHKYEDD